MLNGFGARFSDPSFNISTAKEMLSLMKDKVEEIRTLLDEKIGVNVDYKVVVNPRHSKSQIYGTFGWSHRASIGIDMDDDFEEDDDDDDVSGLFDVYQLPKEKDDWIIVSIHETENLYFVCEDFIGLKKLIEEVF
jgi:hypothetical protein